MNMYFDIKLDILTSIIIKPIIDFTQNILNNIH